MAVPDDRRRLEQQGPLLWPQDGARLLNTLAALGSAYERAGGGVEDLRAFEEEGLLWSRSERSLGGDGRITVSLPYREERHPMKTYPGDRGFAQYLECTDTYGNTVRVKESSAAMYDAVWVFIEGGLVMVDPADPAHCQRLVDSAGNEVKQAAATHLNLEQAIKLRDALSEWIAERLPAVVAEDLPSAD